jgi:dTDP-4-dehydrorhamnose reductase
MARLGVPCWPKEWGELVGLGHSELDITQAAAIDSVLDEKQPGLVINSAAYTAVNLAEQEVEKTYAVNCGGPGLLARACAARDIPLIHLSTDYVFNGEQSTPYREQDSVDPLSIYGQSKWEGEEVVRQEQPHQLILRVSWVFGHHGKYFVKTMLHLVRERKELRIVADQYGCPTYAGDIATTLTILAKRIMAGE